MPLSTPTPQDTGLPAPPTSAPPTTHHTTTSQSSSHKPILLHLGDDIRWNHELYAELGQKFDIQRSYSMGREEFKKALKERKWGDFVGMYRPFWNTGGEMGNWDFELITLLPPSCKIYASAGAGFDWVDTKTMAEHGILYCNAASACTESVADCALFLLLATFRAFTWSFLAARSGSTSQFSNANRNIGAVTHNPNNHVCGIIGLGKIGHRIAQKAKLAFGMKIWYHDVVRIRDREEELEAKWCESLDELLGGSDVVILATPFSGKTLLTSAVCAKFKFGARLVNIARGKLVDEDALNVALDEGRISAAGLDVHANEPVVDERLAKRENVMVLSHTAGASVDSHVGFERLGMENLISFVEGKGALTPVNAQWLKEREG